MAKKEKSPISEADKQTIREAAKKVADNLPLKSGVVRSCRACIHWIGPKQEDVVRANEIATMLSDKPMPPATVDAWKRTAEGLLVGDCTFDPDWKKKPGNHYCGQWEGK